MKIALETILLAAIGAAAVAGSPSPVSAQTMNAPASTAEWAGTWEGKQDGLPSVILKVAQNGGAIQGQAEFYVLTQVPGGPPNVAGKMTVPLVNPHLDGNTLEFQIIREDRSGERVEGPALNFTLRPAGDRAARLERAAGGGEPALEVDMSRTE